MDGRSQHQGAGHGEPNSPQLDPRVVNDVLFQRRRADPGSRHRVDHRPAIDRGHSPTGARGWVSDEVRRCAALRAVRVLRCLSPGHVSPDGFVRLTGDAGSLLADGEPLPRGDDGPLPGLEEALAGAGLSAEVAATVVALIPLLEAESRTPWSADTCLDGLDAAQQVTGAIERGRMLAARELAARTLEQLLEQRGRDELDDDDQSSTAVRLRARAKSVAAHEIEALTGLGRVEARDLVGVATAPEAIREPAEAAMASGTSPWRLVRAFWRRCGGLPHEDAGDVATVLFGDDVHAVAPERLTPEGELSEAPWRHREFYSALDREALRQESVDAAAERAARRRRHEARNACAIVDDDGSARFVLTGSTLTITALAERIHVLAARARKAGDPRTQAQLRHDIGAALLLHGTLPLPTLPVEASLITPEDIEALATVIAGTPSPALQVVVPWDALSDHARLPAQQWTGGCQPEHESGPGADVPLSAAPTPTRTACSSTETGCHPRPGPRSIGQVLGRHSRYLSRAEIRDLASRQSTVLHRLLVDPSDGRCLERSLTSYRPDARMRRQLAASDVTCRAPGCTAPARDDDLDHVTGYLLGGPTAEGNLQHLDRAHHALKTEKFWDAEIDASRNVTWTTFFGRIYRTRPHDYRQYADWIRHGRAADPESHPPESSPSMSHPPVSHRDRSGVSAPDDGKRLLHGPELSPDEQRARMSALVYAALAHRSATARAQADDDDPGADDDLLDGIEKAVWLRHTDPNGRRREGARPDVPAPAALLKITPASRFRSGPVLPDCRDDPVVRGDKADPRDTADASDPS